MKSRFYPFPTIQFNSPFHFMQRVGQLRCGCCNPSESLASYGRRLEKSTRVFGNSIVYAILNWRVLDMASAGASGNVTVEDKRSYIKIGTLRGKNTTEIKSALSAVCGDAVWHTGTKFRKYLLSPSWRQFQDWDARFFWSNSCSLPHCTASKQTFCNSTCNIMEK